MVGHLLAWAVLAQKKVGVKEVVFDSPVADIQWASPSNKAVFLQTSKGRLYRSKDGGEAWDDITDGFKGKGADSADATVVDQIVVSHADRNVVGVVGTKHMHWITDNAGLTWRRVRHKATIHSFTFHPTRASWALVSTWTPECSKPPQTKKEKEKEAESHQYCQHMLYITKDLGRTFQLVATYVVQFNWGHESHGQQDRIYFTRFRQGDGDQPKLTLWTRDVDFCYTDNQGGKINKRIPRGNKFLISNNYIFVAKLKDQDAQTVNLMVSADGSNTFNQATLPVELEEKSYTVLDTSEGAVMLHVNHGNRAPVGVGGVYISDKEGYRYAMSLPNNVRSPSGDCEFDKVLSLEGVYLANFKDNGDPEGKTAEANAAADQLEDDAAGTDVDRKHAGGGRGRGKDEEIIRTVITFDKGGVWSYLKPPKVDSVGKPIECPPDKCWLHLHGVTNFHNFAPFYSLETAAGLIMGTGNVGASLRFETDQVNTYFSRDGGLTWIEAHKGAFIYEFGDHGGLIVMANDVERTKQVVFSWNEGQSWYDFDVAGAALEVDNIVTEPNATTTTFLLYGTRQDTGVLYHLNFEPLGQPACKGAWAADSVSSDYETWMPSDGRSNDKCLLGRQITYTRRKQTSECFNGEQFERPVVRKNCMCSEEDYECEIGFARKVGSFECRPAEDAGAQIAPERCTSSDFFYVDAYRKVAGDTCEGGWFPQKAAVPCPAGAAFSKSALSVLLVGLVLVIVMATITFVSRSEKFKHLFTNYGFDSHKHVQYAQVGKGGPESAVDTVGARYDPNEFLGDDDDEDAPPLVSYNLADDDDEEHELARGRGLEAAKTAVPKISGPPGGGKAADDDDGMDLL